MSMIERAEEALVRAGCPHMVSEIRLLMGETDDESCVVRPDRPLNPAEAMAMIRAWGAAYEGLPVCVAPWDRPDDPCPKFPHCGDCHPDLRDEAYVAETLRMLGRPPNRWRAP